MMADNFFAGEIATELIKMLITVSRKICLCKASAEALIASINELLPVIQEIKYSGVELQAVRQRQLDDLSELLRGGLELAGKVLASSRWNVYKNLQLARKMEKLEKRVARFLQGPMQAHLLADVHHVRFEAAERFDRLDDSARRLEQRLSSMKIGGEGGGGWLEEAVMRVEEEGHYEDRLVNVCAGMEVGKRKVKEMIIGRDDWGVVGITGIGGSGKTTLAREICRDDEVQSYYGGRVFFVTVSQSPNVEQLKLRIWGFVTGNVVDGCAGVIPPQWTLQCNVWKIVTRTLVVLDDVWSLSVLEQLALRFPGCKYLVVSRVKFPSSILSCSHELELLREDEAVSLFCRYAFGNDAVSPGANESLIKQIVEECKGLPLALKVVGSALRDQPEIFWTSAKSRLSRSLPICESHEIQLLERMRLSVDYLSEKVRECFLDLGSFPEDKMITLDVLVNIWLELHDIDEEEAFAILVELSDKNLINLVRDARSGDTYSSYYDIAVSQHDVLRDLAIYLSSRDGINRRKRLLMSRRETQLPKEWERSSDQPFGTQIVSLHTGEMRETDWFEMEFPKAEVLVVNFTATRYFLPPFINNMPKLRSLVLINYGAKTAQIDNISVFTNSSSLRSLWFEKITLSKLLFTSMHLQNLRKVSLILCEMNDSLGVGSRPDFPLVFPHVTELTMDHCVNLTELPSSIWQIHVLKSLSITNCDGLYELPEDLGLLDSLQVLRVYACPNLEKLPDGIRRLGGLKYLDISQCVSLRFLPEGVGECSGLEKIDMRGCLQIRRLPESVVRLRSLRRVVSDEEASWMWREAEKALPRLCVQVAEERFNLDWLVE